MKWTICAVIFWIAGTGSGLAADTGRAPTSETFRKAAWKMGVEFAQCAGLYWALAETEGDPDIRQSIYDTGNGAYLAALSNFAEVMPLTDAVAFTKDETKRQLSYFRADLSVADASVLAKVDSQMRICLALGDHQAQFMTRMRARARGVEP